MVPDFSKNNSFLVHLKLLISFTLSYLLSSVHQKQSRNSEINNQKDMRVKPSESYRSLPLCFKLRTDFINVGLYCELLYQWWPISTISSHVHHLVFVLISLIVSRAILSHCDRTLSNIILCFSLCPQTLIVCVCALWRYKG